MENGKREIQSREDVALLVRAFYKKVRQDKTLGPIFNATIKDWETHLEKLTDFWEGNLFMFVKTKSIKKNQAHIRNGE